MISNPIDLNERLEALTREQRRLKRLIALLFVALAWPVLMAVSGPAGDLQAKKLVLTDGAGKVRAELASEPDGSPALRLLDASGSPTVTLRGGPAGPILEMADGKGGSVWLSASATGASLSLSKNRGEVELVTNSSGYPSARLQDRDGKVVWTVP